jgi:small-conductance mechanosensitive channel
MRRMDADLWSWLTAAATFAVVLGGFLLGRRVLVGRLRWLAERTDTKVDDLVVDLLEMIRNPECYLVAFYAATRPLTLPLWLDRGFRAGVVLAVTYRAATMLQRAALFAIEEGLLKERQKDAGYVHTARTLGYLANAAVWACALLFALSNLGFNVTSMLAGLGIGGIAVALAAQAVLGDLFSAIALYLDRPFVAGDAITFGDTTAVVERIGFKTTRLRALGGELLVVPNSSLTSARIQNWRYLHERRVVLALSAAYGTPRPKLAALPAALRAVIVAAGGDKARVDRVHLKALAASSIDFELVYYVLTSDYAEHMDIQQRVLLGALELFEREGVEIPFPTQTVHVAAR